MTTLVKLEKNLCRCCHEEGYFINLSLPFKYKDEDNTYSELLTFCFDIHVSPVEDAVTDITFTICNNCIEDLRNAYRFKKQVMFCENRFNQMLRTRDIMHVDEMNVPVKDEEKSDSDLDSNIGHSEHVSDEDDSNLNTFLISTDSEKEIVEADTPGPLLKKKIPPKRPATKKVVTKKPITKKALTKKTVRKKQNDENTKESHSTAGQEKTSKTRAINIKTLFRVLDSEYSREVDGFRCYYCEKITPERSYIINHIKRAHHKIPPNCCPDCPEAFYSSLRLNQHRYHTHKTEACGFKCDKCEDRYFYTNMALVNHKKNYHKLGKKLKCRNCNYVCYTMARMRSHEFNHSNIRDYTCSFCAKAFKTRGSLTYHERIHTGDKRKICKICGQAFVQKASLNYHMAKYHPDIP